MNIKDFKRFTKLFCPQYKLSKAQLFFAEKVCTTTSVNQPKALTLEKMEKAFQSITNNRFKHPSEITHIRCDCMEKLEKLFPPVDPLFGNRPTVYTYAGIPIYRMLGIPKNEVWMCDHNGKPVKIIRIV